MPVSTARDVQIHITTSPTSHGGMPEAAVPFGNHLRPRVRPCLAEDEHARAVTHCPLESAGRSATAATLVRALVPG
eukprot:CAMPEP_0119383880 /NCGR_PEP_ID=MMETSP1334-20130426/82397_1 /TAXON_ID=127549 /ORGANISM="Calcidiscus leptoporus, Strain RCC1130" /LENGTH=75 /DNA_ID=CAMNT_0007404799 /DNA_START=128 /DNA_END=351 /DNA_ORIENTATION=+